jgi:uncharacterized membrane protein YdcZ (DUF606 family)
MHVTYRRAQLVQGMVLEHFTFLRVQATQAIRLRAVVVAMLSGAPRLSQSDMER